MTNNRQGFTLIELLVSIIILMVGLLGMLQAINVAMETNLKNIFRTEAVMLADERMMKTRSGSYESIAAYNQSESRNIRGIMKNYSVIQSFNQPTTKSKQVLIRVKWRSKGTAYSHSVESVTTTN